MDYREVFTVLKKIKPGDTLCSDLTIVEHKTWFSSIKRSIYGDTRESTAQIIENSVKDHCNEKEEIVYLRTAEIEDLEQVRSGIQNLAETYSKDKKIRGLLNASHLKLRDFIADKQELSNSESSEDEDQEFDIEESKGEEIEDLEEQISFPDLLIEEEEPRPDSPRPAQRTQKPGSKFEDYLKKKGCVKDRKRSYSTPPNGQQHCDGADRHSERGNIYRRRGKKPLHAERLSAGTVSTHRELPKLHVITMGDVFSQIDELPESLPNPLSQVVESRDVTWYVENFMRNE